MIPSWFYAEKVARPLPTPTGTVSGFQTQRANGF
jgi:hypothetical protein